MSVSSGTETFGGRHRSDVDASPRYMLKPHGPLYAVIDTHDGDAVVMEPAVWAAAEIMRITFERAWNRQVN